MESTLEEETGFAETSDGWRLELRRTVAAGGPTKGRRPLVIVPGYGMNGFIFSYHPRGTSLVRHLAESGVEVWVANLRAQGKSSRFRPTAPGPSLRAYIETDLRTAIDVVLDQTRTGARAVDLLGASLGGSLAYGLLAVDPDAPVGAVISVGSPLSWRGAPLLVRLAFASPALALSLPIRGTRRAARMVLPFAHLVPGALGLYMNPAHVDLGASARMVETIEDPQPRVNLDLARWVRDGDLRLGEVNVSAALRGRETPLMIVYGNRDGIVPPEVALSAAELFKGPVETLCVGEPEDWYAHADLFVGHEAPERVFAPVAEWLARMA